MEFDQLNIPGLLDSIYTMAVRASPRRRRDSVATRSPEAVSVALHRVLARQNLTFATYVIMLAVRNRAEPISIARLSLDVGYSYHAVRNQLLRSEWFELDHGGPLVTVRLIDRAVAKLDRVHQLLALDLRNE